MINSTTMINSSAIKAKLNVNKLNDLKLRITLVDPIEWKELDIYFNFIDSEITSKWIKHFVDVKMKSHFIRESSLKHNCDELSNIYKKFAVVIDIINKFYDQPIENPQILNEDALNYLHSCYEKYGSRLQRLLDEKYWDTAYTKIPVDSLLAKRWPGIEFNQEMHLAFIKLNELIHTLESVYSDNRKNKIGAIITYSLWPRHDFELTEGDYNYIVKYPMFGDVFLGYNTLGKNLEHIVLDSDHEAVARGDIKLQSTWSTEILTHLKINSNLNTNDSDNSISRYKQLWDELQITEKLGINFGEYKKNREGYIKIAEMDEISKTKFYEYATNTVKIEFGKFSLIHDVDIVLSSDAHKSGSLRIPHWKSIPPNQGKQITSIKNNTNIITWVLNNACTYDCYYCPEALHSGDNTKWSWDTVEPFLNQVIHRYGSNTIYSLSGGEPTISPFFPELIRKIHQSGAVCGITTNLSRSKRYIMDNFGYLKYAACSFHPSMVFPKKEENIFVEKAKLAQEYTNVAIRVMMDPLYWDKTVSFINYLSENFSGDVSLVWIQDQYGSSVNKICDISYTPAQNEFIVNYNHIRKQVKTGNELRYSKLTSEQKQKYQNFIVEYADGTSMKSPIPQQLINKGETRFFDWNCKIGKESLFISHDGRIQRANCTVGGIIGTINNYVDIDWNLLEIPVRCSVGWCQCGADVPVTKNMNL